MAYFFASDLVQKLDVRGGIVISVVGGTPVEAWTPTEVFAQVPERKQEATEKVNEVQKDAYLERSFLETLRNWCAANQRLGSGNTKVEWAAPDLRLPVADPTALSDEWLIEVESVCPALSAEAAAAQPQNGRVLCSSVGRIAALSGLTLAASRVPGARREDRWTTGGGGHRYDRLPARFREGPFRKRGVKTGHHGFAARRRSRAHFQF